MPHALLGAAVQVGGGQVAEVGLGPQHGHVRVVDVQERLQIAEPVLRPQVGDRLVGELDAVAPRQVEDHLGFEGAFDVHVQFGLGRVGAAFISRD
ncbi:hypothetical protein GCM10020366_07730 [Saccharopolyspora gregorii]|uniref:Uncharacterized protein n=1 Tax=Saccharopolyspora gregorii TaxID=33914 RepID=A0ABP6RJR5_9PSEU